MKKITIGIVTYNRSRLLKRAVNSVLSQEHISDSESEKIRLVFKNQTESLIFPSLNNSERESDISQSESFRARV